MMIKCVCMREGEGAGGGRGRRKMTFFPEKMSLIKISEIMKKILFENRGKG